MSVNQPPKKEENDSLFGLQPYVLRFAAVLAVALIVLPLLPGLVNNIIYSFHSFGGKAPKIYWYLSRAGGFVSFTILWISMALGLGITNKMAHLWPGAPSAFALHQYTGLLGLAFAAYHGLVLIGDHFVDFSLPRLLVPFSIAYETFWVGLGQVGFFIWLLVVLSFYIRQRIGQKTWRMIHYLNFAVYVMVLMHGLRSGTDSEVPWVTWYFWISAASLTILLAYRIYELSLKHKLSIPKFTFARTRKQKEPHLEMDATSNSPTRPSISTRLRNLPLALLQSQAKKPAILPVDERVLEPISVQSNAETSPQTPEDKKAQESAVVETVGREVPSQSQLPVETPVPASGPQFTDVKKTVNGSVVTLEGTYQGKPIRVRIFGEPVTKPIPEQKESEDEIKPSEKVTLVNRLKNSFEKIPVEPPSTIQRSKHIAFSED
jgi:hypothetical protein